MYQIHQPSDIAELPAATAVPNLPLRVTQRLSEAQAAFAAARKHGKAFFQAMLEAGRLAAEIKQELTRFQGGDRRSAHAQIGPGWVDLCREHMGVSYKTADRYIAEYQAMLEIEEMASQDHPCARIALDLIQEDAIRPATALERAKSGLLSMAPTAMPLDYELLKQLQESLPSHQWARYDDLLAAAEAGDAIAANNLMRAAMGEIPLPRAFAGWAGGKETFGKARKDPDYTTLLVKGTTTFTRGWQRFYDLPVEERRIVTDAWLKLVWSDEMPQELALDTYRALQKRLGADAGK